MNGTVIRSFAKKILLAIVEEIDRIGEIGNE